MPAQVAVQGPPVIVDSTLTTVPSEIVVAWASPVEGPVRSRTPSQAAAIGVPARTSPGTGRDNNPTSRIAETSAGTMRLQRA
jgi:hypothetical protein